MFACGEAEPKTRMNQFNGLLQGYAMAVEFGESENARGYAVLLDEMYAAALRGDDGGHTDQAES